MSYEAKVILDSITTRGHRITTLEVTLPRIVLAELNTHRIFARNSASSRAIPVEKRIAAVEADPFVPEVFGKNRPGMQADEDLDDEDGTDARFVWLSAKEDAVRRARQLAKIGVHKQLANRLLESFLWHTVVITATEFSNWNALRDNGAAAPQIQVPARLMKEAMLQSTPSKGVEGYWHLPYVYREGGQLWDNNDLDAAQKLEEKTGQNWLDTLRKVSVARCAAVTHNRQDVKDFEKDIDRYHRLRTAGHLSPFEHAARPMTQFEYEELFNQPKLEWVGDGLKDGLKDGWKEVGRTHFCGPFQGWVQDRKMIPGEHDFSLVSKEEA